jgi:hypothetical protein
MTTLAANKPRAISAGGNRQMYPVIASDILYEGAAIGLVPATGYARPLTSADLFVGFAVYQSDNSAGAAAGANVEVYDTGEIQLPVTGAVITDIGQPVYATDDDTFTLVPTGGVFIGRIVRFVSAGVAMVAFDVKNMVDPYAGLTFVTITTNTTLDATYSGKALWIATDALTMTLPAVEGIASMTFINGGAFGAVALTIAPNAADMVEGPGITAADNKGVINTKATARRGDLVELGYGDANGWSITRMRGIWARVP